MTMLCPYKDTYTQTEKQKDRQKERQACKLHLFQLVPSFPRTLISESVRSAEQLINVGEKNSDHFLHQMEVT